MSSSTFVGNPDVVVAGPPPPPPPPPPMSGQLPAMRINTAESAATKRPQMGSNDAYEPPAAIQNAMLTKDKKPFTYTPGMGGKLDLSQIRSPRMARRVAKNANDEGIEGPPKSAVEPKPVASTAAPNLFVQPQVAIPVFPTNVPPPVNRMPSNVADKQAEAPKSVVKIDTKVVPIAVTTSQSSTPESPNTPTQITLAKAPTPWLQNKNKPQEELPEWAKRASVSKAGPPESPTVYVQVPPQRVQTWQKEHEQQPTAQQSPPQYQPKPFQRNTELPQRANQQERVIPIQIEDRPSVFDAKREPGQFKQPPTLHHQQRWGQVSAPTESRPQEQTHVVVLSRPEQTVGTYIIPIVVEGNDKKTSQSSVGGSNGRGPKVVQQRATVPVQQHETGPVQSRSFRVLQKITDTDASNDADRRMELSEDERELMNKFKEQVDHETYLHQEEDPRYRGAAIPSRAFRFLQNMTDSTDASVTCAAPARNAQNVANKRQNRNSKSFEETQASLPPSEQQVQEPKKYMGSAIPSRSFRILQAMTAPESIATQENRQADYTRRTENNLPGNQQGVFLPPPPVPFWYPEGWWGYYPAVQYSAPPYGEPAGEVKHSFPPYADVGNVYVGYDVYPLYDQNHARVEATQRESPNGRDATDVGSPAIVVDSSFARQDERDVLPEEINHLDAQSSGTYGPRCHQGGDRNGVTAMNIVGEEENGAQDIRVVTSEPALEKTFGLRINVPNYTYVDTSDSSDDSSDDEQLSRREGDGTTSSNNNTSSSDSDSYLAYSTGLRETQRFLEDFSGNRRDGSRGAEQDTTGENRRSDSFTGETSESKQPTIEEAMQTADDNTEQRQESPCYGSDGAFEATDDPPDDSEATMVSVSLPLRFKFFVSENNEDVTTVIVGDSRIRAERPRDAKNGCSLEDDAVNDVSVDFHVGNDTSVDFTIKRHSENARDAADKVDSWGVEVPQVNFTLRKDPSKTYEEESERDRTSSAASSDDHVDDRHVDDRRATPARDVSTTDEKHAVDSEDLEPRVEVDGEANGITRDDRYLKPEVTKGRQDSREDTDEDEDSGVTSDLSRMISEVDTDSECASTAKNSKKYQRTQTHSRLFRLLNDDSAVQASRKEYLSLPLNTNVYDDSYCSNYSSGLTSPEYSPIHEHSWRRFHDASHPSNVSQGNHTASPRSEQVVPPAHKDDPYFRAWKSSAGPHDVVPSLAHKILDSRMPSWAYKVNVLCPRIKSTKSVPRSLSSGPRQQRPINHDPPTVPPLPIPPTSCANANANYC